MAIKDTIFNRYITAKVGSGLAMRADDTGQHQLSKQVIDGYATAGQAVPADIAASLQELNSITQQEVMLSQAGAGARAALAAGSYDPIATRNRAAELERSIINGSALARNAGAAAELSIKTQQVRALELQNNMTAQTFNETRAANLAQLSLQAAQDRDALQVLEDGKYARAARDHVYKTDATLEDLYKIYQTNDPVLMQQTFGTTDRRIADNVLRTMQIERSADTQARLTGMKDAAKLQAVQLNADGQYTAADIAAMATGAVELPEGISMMAVEEAMREQTTVVEARNALTQAQTQGITDQKQLEQLVVSGMTQGEMMQTMVGVLQASGMQLTEVDLLEFATSGDISQVAQALLEATGGGAQPIAIQTDTGSVVQISAQSLIETLAQRQEEADIVMEDRVYSQALSSGYAREVEEQTRIIRGVEGLLGAPLTGVAKLQVEGLMAGAQAAYKKAARATPEGRALLENEGMRLMSEAREAMVAAAVKSGIPENQLEDIRQGRFTSDETFAGGLLNLLDPSPNDPPVTKAISEYLKSVGATRAQIEAFAKDPKLENLESIGGNWMGGGANLKGIQNAIQGQIINQLTFTAIKSLDTDMFKELPDPVRQILAEATDMRNPTIAEMAPAQIYGNFMQALTIADRMMQQNVPDYKAGTLKATVQEHVNNTNFVQEMFAPGGKITRSSAVAATLFMNSFGAVDTSGPNSLAFDQLPTAAARASVDWLNATERGRQYQDLGALESYIQIDTTGLLQRAGMTTGGGLAGQFSGDADQSQVKAARAAIGQAIQAVYMQKIVQPSKDATTIAGVTLPSFGANFLGTGRPIAQMSGGYTASDQDIIDTLHKFGHSQLADQIAGGLRK